MITVDDLKNILILSHLTDDMIAAMVPHIEQTRYEENEIIFKEFEPADNFYMLKRGKVVLELQVSEKAAVSIGAVKPGFSFGWSAILENAIYTTNAVCAETTEVLAINSEALKRLLENNYEMGYRFTQRLLVIMKKRLDIRSEQLLRVIKNHPDMHHLFDKSPTDE